MSNENHTLQELYRVFGVTNGTAKEKSRVLQRYIGPREFHCVRESELSQEEFNQLELQSNEEIFLLQLGDITNFNFQTKVYDWLLKCFGEEISNDKTERIDRFIEESLELAQSLNYPKDRALALVNYVYDRKIGEPIQELGGVMVTLAALCTPHGLQMKEAAELELDRISQPEIMEKIKNKQATKPTGSALPQKQFKDSTTIENFKDSADQIINVIKDI